MTNYISDKELIEDSEGIKVKRTCWICKNYDLGFIGWCKKREENIGALRIRKYHCGFFELRDELKLKEGDPDA